MNVLILIAGVLSLFTTAGHVAAGGTMFLKPILDSDAPELPKKVFHALFHLITVNFALFTVVLFLAGLSVDMEPRLAPLVLFCGVSYVLYAAVEVIVALTARLPGALKKMFVWVFFLTTGVVALLGYLVS